MSHTENILVKYCREAHAHVVRIRQLVAGTAEVQPPAELIRDLDVVEGRTRAPQVRVLLLGPLKSGKSTLMNVLGENPYLSQISPLPSYPCFIEVRDLEREPDGTAAEEECSLFYTSPDRAPERVSLERGAWKLNRLLDQFIAAGAEARIEVRKVVQKVDMRRGSDGGAVLQGLQPVLVDSPGLFFHERVDEQLLSPARLGRPGEYSRPAEELLDQCDVAIFVVRPEQLFFHVVAGYLSEFAECRYMRAYILVNGSTRAKTQDGSQILDYDQVREAEHLRNYFEKHSSDDKLLVHLKKSEDRLKLHVVDLLEAVQGILLTPGDKQRYLDETETGRIITSIRDFIFRNELPARKAEDLKCHLAAAAAKAALHLESVVEHLRQQEAVLAEKIDAQQQQCRDAEKTLASAAAARVKAEGERDSLARRLESLNRTGQPPGAERSEFGAFLGSVLAKCNVREVPTIADARERLPQILRKWTNGHFGHVTLQVLADAIWTTAVEPALSYSDRYRTAFSNLWRELVPAVAAATENVDWRAANDEVNREPLPIVAVNPVRASKTLPLLVFDPFFRWRGLASRWFRNVRPADLWGKDGTRIITSDADLEKLAQLEKRLLDQIWGAPWNLGRVFEPAQLMAAVQSAYLAMFTRKLGDLIERKRRDCDADLERRAAEEGSARQQVESCRTEYSRIEAELDACRRRTAAVQQDRAEVLSLAAVPEA